MLRPYRSSLSALVLLLGVGCGSKNADQGFAPADQDSAPEDTGAVVEMDSAVVSDAGPDTYYPPHTPKFAKCVIPAGGDPAPTPTADAGDDVASDTGAASDSGAGDASTDGGDGGSSAILHPAPLAAVSSGGPVLKHGHFIAVTYDTDTNRNDIEDFVGSFGCTDWWKTVGREYGVFEADSGEPIHIHDAAPATITDTQIEKMLRTNIVAKTPGWELPGPETVYTMWFDSSVTNVKLGTNEGCSSFGGFHKNFKLPDGTYVAYTVVVDCGQGLDGITGSGSHEFIEAATDPYPYGNPAYTLADNDHVALWSRFGGEVGDLCEMTSNGGMYQPTGYPWVVQRAFSNAASAGGHDPCVPSSVPVYFNTIPELPDDVNYTTVYGETVLTKGILMDVGETKTIYVQVFADGAIVPFTLSAKEGGGFGGGGGSSHLSFKFDKTTVSPGDRVALTITKNSVNTTYNAEPFYISASNGKNTFRSIAVVGHKM